MNCTWPEILAIFRKEVRSELRNRAGLFAGLLVSVLAVVAMGLASQRQRPGPDLAAGILVMTLLFGAVSSLPRTILVEDEQQTFALLRLLAPPAAIFWGKWLYALLTQLIISGITTILFVNMTHVEVVNPVFVFLFVVLSPVAVTSTIMVTGAIVLGESNRWILGAVLALPLLIPQTSLSIGVLRFGFGQGFLPGALVNTVSLAGYSVIAVLGGVALAGALWSRRV